jgi:hypothetical protein
MASRYSLITGLLLLAIVLIIQVQIANAASIEVPKYASDPDLGMVVDGTQFIEYPDEQTKVRFHIRMMIKRHGLTLKPITSAFKKTRI